MLLKELTDVAEPALESKDQRPKRLVPDYAKQAKGFLETRIAMAAGGSEPPIVETVPDHATAERLRVASVLEAQRNQGNFYIQQAIATYERRSQPVQPPKVADPQALSKEKEVAAEKPKPALAKREEKKVPPPRTVPKKSSDAKSGADGKQVVTEGAKPPLGSVQKTAPKAASAKAAPHVPSAATPIRKGLPGPSKHAAAMGGSPAGGGAGPDPVAAWQAKVQGKVSAIKPGQVKGGNTATLTNAATQVAAKRDQETKKLPDDGGKAITPPKEAQGLPPVPDDSSKDAIQLFDKKCGRGLEPQTLPDLAAESPLHHIPIIGKEPPVKTAVVEESKKGDPLPSKEESRPEKKKSETQATPTEEEKEAENKGLSRAGEVVKDEPPATVEVPDAQKVDIGSVVATLIVDEQKHADMVVDDARNEVFRGVSDTVKNSFGATLNKSELTIVDAELRRLAEAAGVEKDVLQKKIDDHRKKLAEQGKEVKEDQSAALADARKKEEESSKAYLKAVDDVRASLERSAVERSRLVKGDVDADKIRSDRDRLIQGINQKSGTWNVNYEDARKRLKEGLDAAAARQVKAYEVAAQEDEAQLNQDADNEEKKKAAREAYRPTKYWLEDQRASLASAVEMKKLAIDKQADGFKKELADAANDARDKIRDSAARRLGYERSFVQKLFDWISDWLNKAKIESDAWARKRAEDNVAAVSKDAAFLDGELAKMSKMTEDEVQNEVRRLTDEQFAIVKAFFESKGQDRVGAVAAGLMAHISGQQRPELVKKLEQEVIACGEFDKVNAVAVARNPGFKDQAKIKSDRLHDAFEGPGTDEALVFATLGGMTAIEAHAVELAYEKRHHENLRERLKDELDDWATWSKHDIDRANAMMAGDQAAAVATELDQAMHGNWNGLNIGVDQDTIFKALRGKSPGEIEAIKKAYREKYGKELQTQLDSELDHWYVSGTHDVDRARALMASDTLAADAIGIDKAMHGGWLGWGVGTDRKAIEDVYAQQRAELEQKAAANGWTSAKLKEELAKRNKALDDSYGQRYAADWVAKHPGESALTAAYDDEWLMSKSEKRLLTGLQEGDLAKVSAARINIEHNSIFYADDKIINKAVQDQYTSEFEDKKRDLNLEIDEEMEADKKDFYGKKNPEGYHEKWSPEKLRARRKAAEKASDEYAQVAGAKNFDKLEQEYDSQYKGQFSGGITSGTPSLGLRQDILNDTQFAQHDKASKLLEQKGHLSDIQEMRYAIQGVGTDDDVVRTTFKGKNKKEMEDFRDRWAKDPENQKLGIKESLDDWVLGDFSGRDAEEMRLNLKYGEAPDDPDDQLAKAQDLAAFEHESWSSKEHFYIPGHGLGRSELDLVDEDVADLKKKVDEFKDFRENHKDDKEYWKKYAELKGDVDSQTTVVESSVTSHRKTVDVVADTVTQVIGAIVTAVIVVVAIIADVATAGGAAAATPAEAAAISGLWTALGISLAGTALTMSAKAVIKGTDAYGWEEVSADAAIGLVDALLAAATAGTAGKLLRGGSQALMKLAEKKALGKLIANFLAHAAEGALQSTPGAILGNAMNKDNYKDGNIILNVLEGAALQVAPGALLAGGIGAFHGAIKDSMLIRARTDPEFQNRVFKKFEIKNPGKTRADFLAQLDHLIGTETTHGFNDPKLQEKIRARVLEHIPPEQRGQFKDVPVRVVPDEEFKALTKSSAGNAVTVFQDGKPTVIMKAGTDLAQLGEEGIHLAQATEPATAAKVKKLDETTLKNWDKLDLDTQLDLYRTKLELEIDAHERLAKALESQKATTRDAKALGDQIERTRANLENLKKRQLEVAGLGPEDKLEIQAGARPKPQYLEQPARLFGKDPKVETPKPTEVVKPKPAKRPRKQVESADRPSEAPETAKLQEKMSSLKEDRARVQQQLAELGEKRRALNEIVEKATKEGSELDRKIRQASDPERGELKEAQREAYLRRKDAWDQLGKLDSGDALAKDLERINGEIQHADILLNPKEHRAALPCFSGNTLVWTGDGPRRIDQVRAGDRILAYDFQQQKTVTETVTETFENATQHFYELQVDGITILATGRHSFWENSQATWKAARQLYAGSQLLLRDGQPATVQSTALIDGIEAPSYNLSVSRCSNYFVGPGVLVHNKAIDIGLGGPFVIYRGKYAGTDPKLKEQFKDKVYVGQTEQGVKVRQGAERTEARRKLRLHKEGKEVLSPDDVEFYTFMSNVELEPLVTGIGTGTQADFLEQRNMDVERSLHGKDNVMNRREQIKSEDHMKQVTEEILKDEAVIKKGYCPR
jgi:hypothetical protein